MEHIKSGILSVFIFVSLLLHVKAHLTSKEKENPKKYFLQGKPSKTQIKDQITFVRYRVSSTASEANNQIQA